MSNALRMNSLYAMGDVYGRIIVPGNSKRVIMLNNSYSTDISVDPDSVVDDNITVGSIKKLCGNDKVNLPKITSYNYDIATEFSDVSFMFRDYPHIRVKGNKGILAIRSEYFKMILSRNKDKSEINVSFDPHIFKFIVEMLYDDMIISWNSYDHLEFKYGQFDDSQMYLLVQYLHEMMMEKQMDYFIQELAANCNNVNILLCLSIYSQKIDKIIIDRLDKILKPEHLNTLSSDEINKIKIWLGVQETIDHLGVELFKIFPEFINNLNITSIMKNYKILIDVYDFDVLFKMVIDMAKPHVLRIDDEYVIAVKFYTEHNLLNIPFKVGMKGIYYTKGEIFDCIIKSLKLPNTDKEFDSTFIPSIDAHITTYGISTPTSKSGFYYILNGVQLHSYNK